jgi:hypothetical protein
MIIFNFIFLNINIFELHVTWTAFRKFASQLFCADHEKTVEKKILLKS